MIVLEKLLILKSISFFRYTPDDTLYQLAAAMTEQYFAENELIIQQGELGDTLFIVVAGEVKVHNENKTLVTIGERQIFGELAALSPEKRIASVTATKDTTLLCIEHERLFDVIYLHAGLAKGLIEMLCQRVREVSAQH